MEKGRKENIMKINFEYELDQKVITPFNEEGIITMCGFDDGGNQYYVKTKSQSQWYKEKELR